MLYKNRSVLHEQNVSLKYSSENIIYQRGPPFRLTSDSFGDSLGSPSEIFFSFEFNWYFVPLECHISQKAICWLICRFFFFYFLKYLFLKKTFPIMRKQSELNSHSIYFHIDVENNCRVLRTHADMNFRFGSSFLEIDYRILIVISIRHDPGARPY